MTDTPIFPDPILVIDDDEFFLLAVQAVLRDRLFVTDLTVCSALEDAMETLVDSKRYGFCLVDLNMPGTENEQMLAGLRQVRPEMKVVVISGSSDRADVLMALSAGASGFIHKGLGVEALEDALRQIASGAVYVPPFLPEAPPKDQEDSSADLPNVSLDALTPRQIEVLRELVNGRSNKEIARELDLSPGTVKFHLAAIFRTLGVQNRVEAATMGAKLLD